MYSALEHSTKLPLGSVPNSPSTHQRYCGLDLEQVAMDRMPISSTRAFEDADSHGILVRSCASGPLQGLIRKTTPDTEPALAGYAEAVRFRAELLSFHLEGAIFPGGSRDSISASFRH